MSLNKACGNLCTSSRDGEHMMLHVDTMQKKQMHRTPPERERERERQRTRKRKRERERESERESEQRIHVPCNMPIDLCDDTTVTCVHVPMHVACLVYIAYGYSTCGWCPCLTMPCSKGPVTSTASCSPGYQRSSERNGWPFLLRASEWRRPQFLLWTPKVLGSSPYLCGYASTVYAVGI